MRNILLATPLVLLCMPALSASAAPKALPSLQGTWVMVSAYETKADGSRITTYGERPDGLMMVDAAGRYSIQIYRPNRAPFRSGTKAGADPSELSAAVMGSSTHYGTVTTDARQKQLVFSVTAASFPNWNGAVQRRDFSFDDGVLTYRVPASASGNGTVAHSVWRRAPSTAR